MAARFASPLARPFGKAWLAPAAMLLLMSGCAEQATAPSLAAGTKTDTSAGCLNLSSGSSGSSSGVSGSGSYGSTSGGSGCGSSGTGNGTTTGGTSTGGTSTGGTTGVVNTGTDGATSFDLCKNGLMSGKVSGFDDFIQEICGSPDELHSFYLANGNIYTGSGDPPLYKNDTPGSNSLEVHLLSSSLVNASAKVYFDLVKLQASDPQTYKNDGYQYDQATTVTELQPATSSSASFHMEYDDGSGGVVKYDAASNFITLADGVAYVSATQGTNYQETVTSFKGMIIIWAKSPTQTYAFTVSDQIYSVQSAQIQATESHAVDGAKAEVTRMYQNAQKAQAANL